MGRSIHIWHPQLSSLLWNAFIQRVCSNKQGWITSSKTFWHLLWGKFGTTHFVSNVDWKPGHTSKVVFCVKHLDAGITSTLQSKEIKCHCLGPYTSKIICFDCCFSCPVAWFNSAVAPMAGQLTNLVQTQEKHCLCRWDCFLTSLNQIFLEAAWPHVMPLTFFCSTEQLKVCFMFMSRMSPTAEATGHSHNLYPSYWLQNVLATPPKE